MNHSSQSSGDQEHSAKRTRQVETVSSETTPGPNNEGQDEADTERQAEVNIDDPCQNSILRDNHDDNVEYDYGHNGEDSSTIEPDTVVAEQNIRRPRKRTNREKTDSAEETNGGPQLTATGTALEEQCQCPLPKLVRKIECVYLGAIKTQSISVCQCNEYPALALMKSHLFAASPDKPEMAFHLFFLEFFSKLRGNAHTATDAFSKTMTQVTRNFRSEDAKAESTFRKNLGNTFFRYVQLLILVEEKRIQRSPSVKFEDGCPACIPGNMFVSLDGNMQLRRQKRGDNDTIRVKEPNYFSADDRQDKYDRDIPTASNGRCTSELRVASTKTAHHTKARDFECGVVGSVCRHEIPLEFTNIFESGEKYKYALAVVDVLVEKYGDKINIMYDIACRFKTALNTHFGELGKLAIGVFHSYAHSIDCQLDFNPRYIIGLGLSDGEGMERLWSYLDKYVSMTRTMSSKNRMLTLHHALSHRKTLYIEKLPETLKRREKRVQTVLDSAAEVLGSISDEECAEQWSRFRNQVQNEVDPLSEQSKKEQQYFDRLNTYYTLSDQCDSTTRMLQSHSTPEQLVLALSKVPESITVMLREPDWRRKALRNIERAERALEISPENRWQKTSPDFIRVRREKWVKSRDDAKETLRSSLVGQKVLHHSLHHRGKLGQKLATQIEKSIHQATKKAKAALATFNAACEELHLGPVKYRPVAFESVKKIDGNAFWNSHQSDTWDFNVIRAYLMKERAIEERVLLLNMFHDYVKRQCEKLYIAMQCETDHGYRRLTELQLNDALRLHKKALGTHWIPPTQRAFTGPSAEPDMASHNASGSVQGPIAEKMPPLHVGEEEEGHEEEPDSTLWQARLPTSL
ncbi:hypothetical protein BJV82DRAFT_662478 [Fennellomyces sp. T-0311]|nr:hypothetical protein BJV82DRAFT_662478 [Fennellomyces sp. T-0311]